jgi:hypothetical protein
MHSIAIAAYILRNNYIVWDLFCPSVLTLSLTALGLLANIFLMVDISQKDSK